MSQADSMTDQADRRQRRLSRLAGHPDSGGRLDSLDSIDEAARRALLESLTVLPSLRDFPIATRPNVSTTDRITLPLNPRAGFALPVVPAVTDYTVKHYTLTSVNQTSGTVEYAAVDDRGHAEPLDLASTLGGMEATIRPVSMFASGVAGFNDYRDGPNRVYSFPTPPSEREWAFNPTFPEIRPFRAYSPSSDRMFASMVEGLSDQIARAFALSEDALSGGGYRSATEQAIRTGSLFRSRDTGGIQRGRHTIAGRPFRPYTVERGVDTVDLSPEARRIRRLYRNDGSTEADRPAPMTTERASFFDRSHGDVYRDEIGAGFMGDEYIDDDGFCCCPGCESQACLGTHPPPECLSEAEIDECFDDEGRPVVYLDDLNEDAIDHASEIGRAMATCDGFEDGDENHYLAEFESRHLDIEGPFEAPTVNAEITPSTASIQIGENEIGIILGTLVFDESLTG